MATLFASGWEVVLLALLGLALWEFRRGGQAKRGVWLLVGLGITVLANYGRIMLGRIDDAGWRVDQWLWLADQKWFAGVGWHIDHWLNSPGHELMWWLAAIAYSMVSAAPNVVFAAWMWHRGVKEGVAVLRCFAFQGPLALLMYVAVPAAGPAYAFRAYATTRPELVQARAVWLNAVPNCMPSVHMSTALLVWWFAGRLLGRWGWLTGAVYVALTVMSTLGSGEHYVVDLVAAVPYAWVMMWTLGPTQEKAKSSTAEAAELQEVA